MKKENFSNAIIETENPVFETSEGETAEFIDNSPEKIDEWFVNRAVDFNFYMFSIICAMCNGENEVYFVGVTTQGIPFEFCKSCANKMKQLKNDKLAEEFKIVV